MKGLVDETEAKKGADGKRCWKGKRYAGTENGKDKCIPVKNEAANPAQQAAIAVNMKKKGQKPKNVDESKAKQYVKPYIENGKQVGWKSSDGYHVKYWRLADSAKAKAYQHAKISPDEVDEARVMTPSLRAAQQNMADLASGEVRRREAAAKSQRGYEREINQKPKKPSSDQIWQKVEYVVSQIYPDGDPADFLSPYLEKNNLTYDDVNRAARKNGYKDVYAYWDDVGLDFASSMTEEELDEACWDDYKQVGMKNKGGKQVPNCVPKESAIMRGLKR